MEEMKENGTTNEDVTMENNEVTETTTSKKNVLAVAAAAGIGFITGWHAKKYDVKKVAERELERRRKKAEKEEKKEERRKLKETLKDAKEHPERYVTSDDVDLEDEN